LVGKIWSGADFSYLKLHEAMPNTPLDELAPALFGSIIQGHLLAMAVMDDVVMQ
jgi:hypothetical protein